MSIFNCKKPKVKTIKFNMYNNPHFFIIVGHNRKARGTTNYLSESEYVFNSRIANKLYGKLLDAGLLSTVIKRPEGSYSHQVRSVCKEIKKIEPVRSFGINLHFNSSKGAEGSEGLIRGTSDNFDNLLADEITDRLSEIGIKERRDDGVFEVDDSHNGAGMLKGMAKVNCLSVIIEPCFDYKYPESIAIFEHEDRYVKILTESVLSVYKKRKFI